jgi:hypothetical protein
MTRPPGMSDADFANFMGLLDGTLNATSVHAISFRDLQRMDVRGRLMVLINGEPY